MGHVTPGMSEDYRENVDNERLIRIVNSVRKWLLGESTIIERPVIVVQAARFVGKTDKTVYGWVTSGKIETIRVGGRIFIPLSAFRVIKNNQSNQAA